MAQILLWECQICIPYVALDPGLSLTPLSFYILSFCFIYFSSPITVFEMAMATNHASVI